MILALNWGYPTNSIWTIIGSILLIFVDYMVVRSLVFHMAEQEQHQACANVLILGASFESVDFLQLLLNEGLSLVCLDKNPALPEDFLSAHATKLKCLAIDFSNLALVREVILQEHITHTIALPVGRSLVALGQLNDEFGFAGPSFAIADTLTDKLKFHEFCTQHDINQAPYLCFESSALPLDERSLARIEETLGYPLIAKPNLGSGSLGVRVIASREELLSYRLPERFAEGSVLLEKLILGDEFSVNIFADDKGECHIMGIFKKEISPAPYRQEVAYFCTDFSEYLERLKPFFANLIAKLQLRSAFLHADTLISKDEQHPFIVDISPRLAGNNVLSLLCQVGNNPLSIFKRSVIENKRPVIQECYQDCVLRFFNFEHDFVYHPSKQNPSLDLLLIQHEQAHIVQWRNNLQPGNSYGPMQNGADTARGFVLVNNDKISALNELTLRLIHALNYF